MATRRTSQGHTHGIYESKIDPVSQRRPHRQWKQQEQRKATRIEFTKARSAKYYNSDNNDNRKRKNTASPHGQNLRKRDRTSATTTTTTTMETARTTQSHTNRIYASKIDQVLHHRPQRPWKQQDTYPPPCLGHEGSVRMPGRKPAACCLLPAACCLLPGAWAACL